MSVDQDKKLFDLYTLQQQGASGEWSLSREIGELLESDNKASCVRACEVVMDERNGTKSLFLALCQPQRPLVSTNGKETTVYRLLMYSPARRKLLNYGEETLAVSAEEGPRVGKISILDGPIVVWIEGSQLQIMHTSSDCSQKMLRRTYNLENLISDHFCLVKVMDLWPFLWMDETINSFDIDCMSLFIVFLKLNVAIEAASPDSQSTTEWVCLQIKLSFLEGLAVKLLQESDFIPRDYGSISMCVALHKSYSAGLSSGDIASKRQFLVGTEYHQVVLLDEGKPLQCVALKYVPYQICLINVSWW